MFRNYFKLAFRTLWRQKFYTALNIFGLSLGIAVGLVLFQFIRFHLGFDRYHTHADQLYRVVTELHLDDGSVIYEKGSPLAIGTALQASLPQVKDAAVLLQLRGATVGVPAHGDTEYFTEHSNIGFADPHWFGLFNYTWANGDAQTALTSPNKAVITQKLAVKYFGHDNPVGRTLVLDNHYTVTVAGILKNNPDNTDLQTDIFLSRVSMRQYYPGWEEGMMRDWGAINSTTQSYVRLTAGVSPQKAEAVIAQLQKAHFSPDVVKAYRFKLQPLSEVHFDGRFGGSVRRSLLITLACTGLFIVLIGCFNFINMATAQSMKRAKEIGTRKVLGGTPISIFWQFITEITSIVLLATALSFLWVICFHSLVANWLQVQLHFNVLRDPSLLLGLVSLLVFVVLVSGVYPAFVLSRFKPVAALQQQRTGGPNAVYRKGLVILQHVIVQGLIVCSLIITLQVRHLKTADIGYNREAVLMIPIPDTDKQKMSYLANELRAQPGIQSLSFCFQAPSGEAAPGGSIKYDDRNWEAFPASTVVGDAAYLSTFQLTLLAGDNLQESDTIRQVLINQTLLHKLGFKEPGQAIGHTLTIGGLNDRTATISGVVKDFNVHALYTPMDPVVITTQRDQYRYAAIKLAAAGQGQLRERIRKAWQAAYPTSVFEYRYVDEQIDAFYHKEDLLSNLIRTTTVIAIIISCLGLLGLISFFTLQRTKEIGIRKVLGASVAGIVYLLSKDFFILLLLSMAITAPFAWYGMSQWLQGFAYRINISWWMFGLSGLMSVLITLFTVSYQAIKAAFANPVKSLKMD
ncbi:FtsX-like permease family protein [Chitinophaga agrisoli]|uniref:FtsX-like permease family protein n=1 Tax=Chitinophaga agrisoli TaxID=2607653 RepID=A0A5B2VHS7_9BACT|nr:ABC transporter permease [Chitinophaga agrisoli]KAA2238455.1 FtsX-like permease family protein [Chitinophaga agrisoli]